LLTLRPFPLQNDGYSLYYPNGLNSAMNKAAIKLMKVRPSLPSRPAPPACDPRRNERSKTTGS